MFLIELLNRPCEISYEKGDWMLTKGYVQNQYNQMEINSDLILINTAVVMFSVPKFVRSQYK